MKIYTKIIDNIEACNDCPNCDAQSIDCVAYAYCTETHKDLPCSGGEGTGIMCMEIPEWCPLPDMEA